MNLGNDNLEQFETCLAQTFPFEYLCVFSVGESVSVITDYSCVFPRSDITALYSDPPPGLCVIPDPNNITKVQIIFLDLSFVMDRR